MAMLDVKNISKSFGSTHVLKDISFSLEQGESIAVIGVSGSGKTTLLRCLTYLEQADQGTVSINGKVVFDAESQKSLSDTELRERRLHFGMVFQSFNLISRTSALKNVELPMTYARVPKAKRAVRAQLLLERVGLGARKEHMPNELSGGQRQRVAIARALANEPPLILADEPTGNLDTASSVEIMELFTKLHQEGATVVLVTHEEDIAAFAHRVIRFSDGQIQKLNAARVTSEDGKGGEQNAD